MDSSFFLGTSCIKTRRPIIQFETRNFGHHCQYTVKKCKIGFTLLTSMTDMRLTWTENKFQNLTFECHVDNKE
jgi:hypothetical protein